MNDTRIAKRRFGKEFVDLLCSIVSDVPMDQLYEKFDSEVAEILSAAIGKEEAFTKKHTPRTILRWCRLERILAPGTFDRLVTEIEKLNKSDFDEELKKELQAAYSSARREFKQKSSKAEDSENEHTSLTQKTKLSIANATYNAVRERAHGSITAKGRIKHSKGIHFVDGDELEQSLRAILVQGLSQYPCKVRISGPPGSQKAKLAFKVAMFLAEQFNSSQDPVPICICWKEWNERISRGKSNEVEEAVCSLMEVVGCRGVPTRVALQSLAEGHFCLIIHGYQDLPHDGGMRKVLENTKLLMLSGHTMPNKEKGNADSVSFYTHEITVDENSASEIAQKCRERMSYVKATGEPVGSLGDDLSLLKKPLFGAIALDLATQAKISHFAFSSDAIFHASIVATEMLKTKIVKAKSQGAIDEQKAPLIKTKDEAARATERGLSRQPILELSKLVDGDSLIFDEAWEQFEIGRSDLSRYYADLNQFDNWGGDSNYERDFFKASKVMLRTACTKRFEDCLTPQLFSEFDARSLYFIDRLLVDKGRIIGEGWKSPICETIEQMEQLDANKEGIWTRIAGEWPRFASCLGILASRMKEEGEIIERLKSALVKQFKPEYESYNEQATLRFRAAQACSILFDATELATKFAELKKQKQLDDDHYANAMFYTQILRSNNCFSFQELVNEQVAGGSSFGERSGDYSKLREAVEEYLFGLLDSEFNVLNPKFDVKNRHLRYHLLDAIESILSPESALVFFRDYYRRLENQKPATKKLAIEKAFCLGVLNKLGDSIPLVALDSTKSVEDAFEDCFEEVSDDVWIEHTKAAETNLTAVAFSHYIVSGRLISTLTTHACLTDIVCPHIVLYGESHVHGPNEWKTSGRGDYPPSLKSKLNNFRGEFSEGVWEYIFEWLLELQRRSVVFPEYFQDFLRELSCSSENPLFTSAKVKKLWEDVTAGLDD